MLLNFIVIIFNRKGHAETCCYNTFDADTEGHSQRLSPVVPVNVNWTKAEIGETQPWKCLPGYKSVKDIYSINLEESPEVFNRTCAATEKCTV